MQVSFREDYELDIPESSGGLSRMERDYRRFFANVRQVYYWTELAP